MRGLNVSVVRYPCPQYPSTTTGIASCRFVAGGLTDLFGAFSIPLPASPGSYYVFSNGTADLGGAGWYFDTVSNVTDLGSLSAQPKVPYGNATFSLPGYNDLNGYRTAVDQNVQVPLLSWTSDGAFYVNRSLWLVFFNFHSGRLTPIAPWVPLFRNICYYGCQKNTEWVTPDGAFAYELGCLSVCGSASTLTFFAVNVTTGSSFEWNWTGVTSGDTYANGQVNLVGLNGSSTIAVLTTSSGAMWAWSLVNRTQWKLTTLPFFEANNLYWIPNLDSWFNIAANGATNWLVDQYRQSPTTLVPIASATWGPGGAPSNYVAGIDYNLTDHTVYWTAGYCVGSAVYTGYATLGAGGVISSAGTVPGGHDCGFGRPLAQGSAGGFPTGSSEHRIGLGAHGPWPAGTWNNTFYNDSWLIDPGLGQWYASNVSLVWGTQYSGGGEFPVQDAYDEEGFFFNGSYTLSEEGLNCDAIPSCLIDQNTSLGQVYYYWRMGEKEFPFPSDAPLAEDTPPAAPVETSLSAGGTYLNLSWAQPVPGSFPLLNYTAYWGPGNSTSNSRSLLPTDRSVNISGLVAGQTYRIDIVPLNLHFFGAPLEVSAVTRPGSVAGGAGPSGLRELGGGPTWVSLGWTDRIVPTGLADTEVFYHEGACLPAPPAPGAWSWVDGADPNSTSTNVSELFDHGTYCFAAAFRSSTGLSNLSNSITVHVGTPFGLTAIGRTSTSIRLAWSNPVGVDRDTIEIGSTCNGWTGHIDLTLVATYNMTGLGPGDPYCFEVEGWSQNTSVGSSAPLSDSTVPAGSGGIPEAVRLGVLGVISADVFQTVEFFEPVAGMNQSYSQYDWHGLPIADCSGLATSQPSCEFPQPAGLSIYVNMVDQYGNLVRSADLNFSVRALPVIDRPGADRDAADVGQRQAWNVHGTGWGSLEYEWRGLPTGDCSGLLSPAAVCGWKDSGSYNVSVSATDANGGDALSPSVAFTISPAPVLSNVTPSRPSIDLGQAIGFAVTVTGGLAPYSFRWASAASSCGGTSNTTTCRPFGAGIVEVAVVAVDGNGETSALVISPPVPVAPALAVGPPGTSALSTFAGGDLVLTSSPTGGSGDYVIDWSGLPVGCPQTGPRIDCRFLAAGSYAVSVSASDSNGVRATSSPTTIVIHKADLEFLGISVPLWAAFLGIGGAAAAISGVWIRRRRARR